MGLTVPVTEGTVKDNPGSKPEGKRWSRWLP